MSFRRGGATSKYRAVPTVVDGIRFASQKEARRYQELKLLERAGEIRGLVLQPRFPLWAHTGQAQADPIRVGEYRGDFVFEERCQKTRVWCQVVEDVKGVKTPLYRWKKRHVEAQYGITIREV